ncbi:hypothetical protein [Aeromicrobium sp. Leaf350]|uniref:hypothetical protein n=1 Tax=Aeromicrobium sp. Leaf350 TaxID=2876565 RepID=UPI001E5DF823|nr:hypothetical protein [Aeromicrobium sp. Leaf350]
MAQSTRWAPVAIVLVAAPWFAEMSWGGYPFTDIPAILLFLAPMYGGAALLIREIARRSGRGWPTILLLAAAFGVLQAGLVDQSLFNPAYDRFDFQHPAHVDGIDVSLYYLLAFTAGHVVASIAAPIMVAETWSRHGSEPWLTRRTTWVFAGLYALATLVNHLGVKEEAGNGFQARPVQSLVALVTVAALVTAALRWRSRRSTERRVPPPWVLVLWGFLAYLLYLPGESSSALVVGICVAAATIAAIGTWSRSTRWTDRHTLALVLGSILVGVVMPFWSEPYDDQVGAGAELVADVVAAAICLAIVAVTVVRGRSTTVHEAAARR